MLKIVVCALALLLCHQVLADEAQVDAPIEDIIYNTYRLPTAITPENYKLNVITHLNDTEGFVFRGSVWITVSYFARAILCNSIEKTLLKLLRSMTTTPRKLPDHKKRDTKNSVQTTNSVAHVSVNK